MNLTLLNNLTNQQFILMQLNQFKINAITLQRNETDKRILHNVFGEMCTWKHVDTDVYTSSSVF